MLFLLVSYPLFNLGLKKSNLPIFRSTQALLGLLLFCSPLIDCRAITVSGWKLTMITGMGHGTGSRSSSTMMPPPKLTWATRLAVEHVPNSILQSRNKKEKRLILFSWFFPTPILSGTIGLNPQEWVWLEKMSTRTIFALVSLNRNCGSILFCPPPPLPA